MSRLILIGGGVRSGKSRFALQCAQRHRGKLGFIATAQAFDEEMEKRIEDHKRERADAFDTIEAPLDLVEAVRATSKYDAVVIDCLTLWLSNQLLRGDDEAQILSEVDALIRVPRSCELILVTNEVGMGIVPESALGRAFRDLAGRAHQRISRDADGLYASMLGCMIQLKPGPISLITEEDHDA